MSDNKDPWAARSELENVALFVAAVAGFGYLVARVSEAWQFTLPACLVAALALAAFIVLFVRRRRSS